MFPLIPKIKLPPMHILWFSTYIQQAVFNWMSFRTTEMIAESVRTFQRQRLKIDTSDKTYQIQPLWGYCMSDFKPNPLKVKDEIFFVIVNSFSLHVVKNIATHLRTTSIICIEVPTTCDVSEPFSAHLVSWSRMNGIF